MGKWRRKIIYALAILLVIAAALAWDGRAVAHVRFAGDAHRPSLNHDFSRLATVLPGGTPALTELYRGLPHPFHDRETFARELWTTSNRSIHGYRFYKQPGSPSAAVRSTMVDVLSKKKSFRAYGGPKMCGGYHADFAVKLEDGGNSTWFLVCLGCGEVLIYSKGKELICEFEKEAELGLKEAWKDHLGIPFTAFGTRLPINVSALATWGLVERGTWDSRPIEASPPGTQARALVRTQSLGIYPRKRKPEEQIHSFKLVEETYESAEQAERRAKDFYPRQPSVTGRKKGMASPREGFAFEKRVYWISGRDENSREEVRRVLDLLRRYCEETSTHEVRFYE